MTGKGLGVRTGKGLFIRGSASGGAEHFPERDCLARLMLLQFKMESNGLEPPGGARQICEARVELKTVKPLAKLSC